MPQMKLHTVVKRESVFFEKRRRFCLYVRLCGMWRREPFSVSDEEQCEEAGTLNRVVCVRVIIRVLTGAAQALRKAVKDK